MKPVKTQQNQYIIIVFEILVAKRARFVSFVHILVFRHFELGHPVPFVFDHIEVL